MASVLDAGIDAAEVLLAEHQPDKTVLALGDWERNYDLPDRWAGGVDAPASVRYSNLLERIAGRGNLSIPFILGQAEKLGYPGCTVTEYGPTTCADPCDSPVNGVDFVGVWRLNVPVSTAVVDMTCASTCDSPLRSWGNALLEHVINRRKPAHTVALFAYQG